MASGEITEESLSAQTLFEDLGVLATAFGPPPSGEFECLEFVALPSSTNLHSGYRLIHGFEQQVARYSVHFFAQGFDVWDELLTLLLALMDKASQAPRDSRPQDVALARRVQIQLASVVIGTSKFVADGCRTGYYTQSLALIRQLIESWRCIAYLGLKPGVALNFVEFEESGQPKDLDRKKLIAALLGSPYHRDVWSQLKPAYDGVLNGHAHVSSFALPQTSGITEGYVSIGPNFVPQLAIMVIDLATLALFYICQELSEIFSRGDDDLTMWLAEIVARRNQWMEERPLKPISI